MPKKNGLFVDRYGTKRWYMNGKLHRDDGPAIEYADGSKFWYMNDKLHRVDGPTVEYANGSKHWYHNGKQYTFIEWIKLAELSKDEICELVLYYG